MKAEILKLLLPVRARLERFTRHQLALLPELLLLLLCDDELEPKPLRETLLLDDEPELMLLRETCDVPMDRLPGRASDVVPSAYERLVLP